VESARRNDLKELDSKGVKSLKIVAKPDVKTGKRRISF